MSIRKKPGIQHGVQMRRTSLQDELIRVSRDGKNASLKIIMDSNSKPKESLNTMTFERVQRIIGQMEMVERGERADMRLSFADNVNSQDQWVFKKRPGNVTGRWQNREAQIPATWEKLKAALQEALAKMS